MTAVFPKKFTLTSRMVSRDGLNNGSLMSARKCCLSLTPPSHSVLTNRLSTRASRAAASRLTCASFHMRSRTSSLSSRGSVCWAKVTQEQTVSNKQQPTMRSMVVQVRRHPYVRANSRNIAARRTLQLRKSPQRDYERHRNQGRPRHELLEFALTLGRQDSRIQIFSIPSFGKSRQKTLPSLTI